MLKIIRFTLLHSVFPIFNLLACCIIVGLAIASLVPNAHALAEHAVSILSFYFVAKIDINELIELRGWGGVGKRKVKFYQLIHIILRNF